MTPQEFKAWFDGFTEAFDGKIPTKTQWGRIKERVDEIDGRPITERVYVDRYWPTYPIYRYFNPYVEPSYTPTWTTTTCGGVNASTGSHSVTSNITKIVGFNSISAMNELGRAEALGVQ